MADTSFKDTWLFRGLHLPGTKWGTVFALDTRTSYSLSSSGTKKS